MKWLYLTTILLFLGLAACDVEQDCSGTVSATYTIGSDVTADFNVTEKSATAQVLTSDCDNLPAGETVNETIDSIVRSSDTITVTEGSEVIEMTVSGTTINQFTRAHTIAGCTITVILAGSLDTTNNALVTEGAFAAKGLTCTQPF